MRKKFTMLLASLLACVGVAKAQVSLYVGETLPGTLDGGQYTWKSDVLTAPEEGLKKLRVTFLENTNKQDFHGYPCVALAEFYLYDKAGEKVPLTKDMFSSNATETQEGSIGKLCDGNTTRQEGEGQYDWYWHSFWSAAPNPKGHHYLELDLSSLTAVDLSTFAIGWVTRQKNGSPAEVIISTGATSEDAYLSSLFAKNGDAPLYYAIRNVRNGNYYATYARDNGNVLLNTAISPASLFYFTGAVENGVATVKIQNKEAAALEMAAFNSWTAEGIDWYIQKSGNKEKPGYAISKENNLTDNAHSWNNAGNTNTIIANWNGNDVGSTFELIPLSSEDIKDLVYISGPDDLVSGNTYNFRNLSALKFLTGGDKLNTDGNRNDKTPFAYYVSSYTGAKYLYNIAAKKFVGTTSTADADIPLSEKPVSTELTFKKTNFGSFPIMFSTNKGGGAVNYSGWYGKVLNWQGGFGDASSKDNSFCVEKVSVVDETTLATIEQLVGDFELPIWKEEALSVLGCVGGYALDLQDEIEAITTYTERVAFETANQKISLNANSCYRLTCVAPKKANGEVTHNTLTYNGANNLVTAPANTEDINQIFCVEPTGDGNTYYLQVLNADKYLNKISAGSYRSGLADKADACKVEFIPYGGVAAQYRLHNSQGKDEHCLFAENHAGEAVPYACSGWEAGANSASAWRLVEVSNPYTVSLEEAVSDALGFMPYFEQGRYTSTMENVESEFESVNLWDPTGKSAFEVKAKLAKVEEIISSFVIEYPTVGFYYFVNYENDAWGEYLSDDRKSDSETQRILTEEASAKNIFYYDGATILSYASGFGFEQAVCNTKTPGKMNDFTLGLAHETGCFTVKSSIGSSEVGNAEDIYWMNNNGELAGTEDANDASGWNFMKVTSLPVTVGDRLHATFFAPVAVTIPEGIRAYTGEVNGEWLTLTEVEGTIPAGTAVVLIAQEAKTYEFKIVENAAAAVVSDLRGTAPTIVNDKNDEEDKYYTLQPHGENGVAFRPYTGANFGGFKAYLKMPDGANAAALRIRFAGEEDATGIEGIELGEELVIYDLAGRRVQKMEKGIYIVNGKKVVIK